MLTTRIRTVVVVAAVHLAAAAAANAGIVALFTLDNTLDVTKSGAVTAPTLTLSEWPQLDDYVGGTSFTDADGEFHGTAFAAGWQDTSSGNAGWLLDVDTRMYKDLFLRFDNRSSGTGATSLAVDWAIDGGPFTNIETVGLNRSSTFTAYTVDLSAIASIENASNVQLRGLWGTDGTAPNTRLDNLQLTGTPVVDTLAFFPFNGNSPADAANADNVTVSTMGNMGGTLTFVNNEARLAGLDSQEGGYYTFTMTPKPGYELLLYSLDFMGKVGSGTEEFVASMVIDGVETELMSGTLTDTYALQELTGIGASATSPVEFRIFGSEFDSAIKTLRIDSVTVTGLVVPEPSALLLLGVGMIGLLGFGRRRTGASSRS